MVFFFSFTQGGVEDSKEEVGAYNQHGGIPLFLVLLGLLFSMDVMNELGRTLSIVQIEQLIKENELISLCMYFNRK